MNDVVIEKLVVGGKGLGRLDNGMVVLVPFVIPGEQVRVQPLKSKKTFQEGLLKEVLNPSPDRITPPCPHFGNCGGCHYQHITSQRQDVLKREIFHDELQRSGLEFGQEAICYFASPLRFGYRQRIRLHVHGGRLGFFQQGSHSLLAIDQCLLARPEINAVLQGLIDSDKWSMVADYVDEVGIHVNPATGTCILIVRFSRKPRPRDLSSLQAIVAEIPELATLIVKAADGSPYASYPAQPDDISYLLTVGDGRRVEVAFEPGGFCQVNEEQNQRMVDQVLIWLDQESQGTVLDLFCGVGNFSLPLAMAGFRVTGIDQQRSAIRSAQRNSAKNKLSCEFRRSAAQAGLEEIVEAGQTFDYVVLDPPRAGFKEGSAIIPALQASKIIYVSCDQATLFRDLKEICRGGYEISAITLVDQFSQSHHLESMVLLSRV